MATKKAPGNVEKLKKGEGKKKDSVTAMMRLFVIELQKGNNITQSAINCGYNPKSAHSRGNALMKHPFVIEEMAKWVEVIKADAKVTHQQITDELVKWAFIPVTDFIEVVNVPGTKENRLQFKETTALDPVKASMVKSLKIGKNGIVEMTFKSAETALDMLAKHVGYYGVDNSQKKQEGVMIYVPDNGRGDTPENESHMTAPEIRGESDNPRGYGKDIPKEWKNK